MVTSLRSAHRSSVMPCGVWLLCLGWLLAAGAPLSEAATRLGLHVTQEELSIWRQRMTDNVNTINGYTYQSIYQTRILADANAFRSQTHPGGDGFWAGQTSATCAPQFLECTSPYLYHNGNGALMARAAFVYLLTGDVSYANPIRAELLNQITVPGTNWADRTRWCTSVTFPSPFKFSPWVFNLLLSYDYLLAAGYTGFSAAEKTNIETWFKNHADYVIDIGKTGIGFQGYGGIFNTPPTGCVGAACTNPYAFLYYQGPTMMQATYGAFFNQATPAALLAMAVGVRTNTASHITYAKQWLTALIKQGMWDNGALPDYSRWNDCSPGCPGSMWDHEAGHAGAVTAAIDILARTGDTSLYTQSQPNQTLGSSGSVVSWQTALELWARMANKTTLLYGTTTAGGVNPNTLLTWDSDLGATKGNYSDFSSMAANLFYQNAHITTAMTRAIKPAAGNSQVTGCNDSKGGGCYSGIHAFWPDLPFMLGNMAGQVNPYTLGPTASNPTCTVTAPTTFPIYDTAQSSVVVSGTAGDADGTVSSVAVTCSPTCGSPSNTGTATAWSFTVPVTTGATTVTVTATDNTAATGTCALSVRRQTAADATSNLLLHLPLDEGASTVANNTVVGQNDGTLSNAGMWVPGYLGPGAVLFNEATDSLTVSGFLGSPAAVTLEARFKLATVPSVNGDVISIGNAVAIRISSTTLTGFFNNGTTWELFTAPWTGDTNWHDIAWMVKPGEQTLYLDGQLLRYGASASSINYVGMGSNTVIGVHGGGEATLRFEGMVDNPRIWGRYLTRVDLAAALTPALTPPVLTITTPTSAATWDTATTPVLVAGTASDPDGTVTAVSWACTPSCGSGLADMTSLPTWTIAAVPVTVGANVLTVTATDNDTQNTPDTLTLVLTAPVVPSGAVYLYTGHPY